MTTCKQDNAALSYVRTTMSIVAEFSPFPVLETPRLILRAPEMRDAADIFEFRSDPEVMKYIPKPLATSVADVEELLVMIQGFVDRNERINWVIELKETGKVLGLIGYPNIFPDHDRAEVGYTLNGSWHRQGIMREALAVVLRYGFERMQLHSILAVTDEQNIASSSLLTAVGFRHEGCLREDFCFQGNTV